MAPKYTLIYYNAYGYGEISRLILAQAGVDYVDRRMVNEEWPQVKKEMPYGQVPVLDVDGVKISDSRTIARYLAREHGLDGKTSLEKALADSVVDAVYDLNAPQSAVYHEKDEATKAEKLKKYAEETAPAFLGHLQARLDNNGTGFLVGDSLTWADIVTSHALFNLQTLQEVYPESCGHILDAAKFKGLIDLQTRVFSLPNIKKWIEKRPKTRF